MNQPRFGMTLRLLLLIVPAFQACTILPAVQDRSRFYVLTPATGVPAPAAGPANNLSIGVGPVSFPGYLKRPEMVTRTDSDRIELSEESRWAGPLDSNFQSVLAQDLSRMLGTQRIVLFPWFGNPKIDYQIEVQVYRFDTGPGNNSQLVARWTVRDGDSGAELFATESTASNPVSGGDAGRAAALSSDVAALSREISSQIIKLDQDRASSGK
jgi:uncharacterized protein